ncbi:MAG: peptide ABC transporter permease, partial [Deltaproteobacteria bacterium]|nr:peptide ABC transporter permease [Deltaproteobacteria bacterium]
MLKYLSKLKFRRRLHRCHAPFMLLAGAIAAVWAFTAVAASEPAATALRADIEKLASLQDRSTGTPGNRSAAVYIRGVFETLGLEEVGAHKFSVPVIVNDESRLSMPGRELSIDITPVILNAITPQTISPDGINGPLVYVANGDMSDFNGKLIEGAIVLMNIDSGKNWLNAASLGAAALIYVDGDATLKMLYKEKMELSPIQFPRFRMEKSTLRNIFGDFESSPEGIVAPRVQLTSKISWQEVVSENIYGLIPGSDPQLRDQLVIIEAFYDSTTMLPGYSPGADEGCSIATLLGLAHAFVRQPPGRSVLLVATSGHAQTLAGMREMIWSIVSRSKDLRDIEKELQAVGKQSRNYLKLLEDTLDEEALEQFLRENDGNGKEFLSALKDRIKTEVDTLSRRLMRLRLLGDDKVDQDLIQTLAQQRFTLRRLVWRTSLADLSAEDKHSLQALLPLAAEDHKRLLADTNRQLKLLASARDFRSVAKSLEIAAVVSLHLSSHGNGFGAFNDGWLYPLRPRVNRVPCYSLLDEVLRKGAKPTGATPSLYRDTLRPSSLRTWQSCFLDKPFLGGEVSALAGYLGFTLATVNDARAHWGTPADGLQNVNWSYAAEQSAQIAALLKFVTTAPALHDGNLPRDGFTSVTGHAKFLRHGELFADQAAPETIIMAFQGKGRYYSRVDNRGVFCLKGVATKKLVQDKVIIEGYRFDPVTGEVIWAIDKKQTGKSAYRLEIRRSNVETDLIMFGCRQMTLFNLLEPRSFRYMSKIQLIDTRREAKPSRYWWSRIDTRSSVIASMYVEPGSRIKITLSDTVLKHKLILLNADADNPEGVGYLVDEWPNLYHTDFLTARDMWALLGPRIENLETNGIFNERISRLRQEGIVALKNASQALEDRAYDRFAEAARRSWALASRVYSDIDKTQKDVLFGVLFYIALFVPFAFCMERLLFAYTNINKRIIAFCAILLLLIAVIYHIHPAFRLAYSPTVVILAFFIMGLSFVVTLIIYFRFEEEMTRLQKRAHRMKISEIGRWKAFTAAFLLGASNLKRRRLRTALTCTTLTILTFTVMSFTSVKSMRLHTRLKYKDQAPYHGYLFKNVNWFDLPREAFSSMSNYFEDIGIAVPRVWLEDSDPTRSLNIPIQYKGHSYAARGLVGLSADEDRVTGLDRILVGGRWFRPDERRTIILPERMAKDLGLTLKSLPNANVKLWGLPFKVVGVFSGKALMEHPDLDDEPITPVTFPSEVSMEMTEVEMEALASGEEIRTFQSRYHHIDGDLTVIVPYQTLLSMGGKLKAIAVKPETTLRRVQAEDLVDRFGLTLYTGEAKGIYLYTASDTMSYSGVPNIVIPLIISVFIVLNTMISSVYERKREIGIYTSVGLAPSHVSFLFIAEALAFAVISVVLGYLLAQVSASLFAETTIWEGITVNYSSMAGVAAMVLVMLVVLISAIYPSKVAAEIAIPDVNRSWKMPPAKGNILDITLPFLMSQREHLSIGGFLFEYFQGHRDVSHGLFSADELRFDIGKCYIPPETTSEALLPAESVDVAVQPDNGEYLQLYVDIWLAPFDFGIMQSATIAFCRAQDDHGYLEIRVRLTRYAGEANAWCRINKAFVHNLRKQLLIW